MAGLNPAALRRAALGRLARVRGRGTRAMLRALRLTVAAVAAYLVALLLSSNAQPLLAPLTALLVVQVTLYGTLTHGLRRVVSVVAGVLVAVGFSALLGFTWWSLGLLVAASIVLGQVLRLGPHLLEVPISAMLVLAVGGSESAAAGRIVETLIGAAVGVLGNVVVPPAVQVRPAGDALEGLAQRLAALLDAVADGVGAGASREEAFRWLDEARGLGREVLRVDAALARAEESRRLNPRARHSRHTGPSLRTGLDALEHCIVAARGMCRSFGELAEARGEAPAYGEGTRRAVAALLHSAAEAVRAFGRVVRSELDTPSAIDQARLGEALDTVRAARIGVGGLLLADAEDSPLGWEQNGALLAHVDRIVRELDADERARARAGWARDTSTRTRRRQAVQRLRASTRRVPARLPRRQRPH